MTGINRRAVATTSLALTMAVLDGSVITIALPSITRDFGVSPGDSILVVNAYQITVLVLLLPLGAVGEIFGYARVYRVGLVVFTLASLGSALAPSLEWLILARILQGIGAAGIMSINAGLIRAIYPLGQIGRGIGINALVVALASAMGPALAAALLSVGPWPILFAVNVPLGILTLLVGRGALPPSDPSPRAFDWASAVLNGGMLALAVLAVDGLGGRQPGWQVLAEAGLAVVFGLALLRRQRGRAAPLLPLDLLSIPVFRLSVMASILGFCAAALALISLPFWLQQHLGVSDAATGLWMTPWPLAVAAVAPLAGLLADRHSPGLLGAIGMALFCAGLVVLGLTEGAPGVLALSAKLMLCGAGFALFQSPNNRAMLTAAPPARAGAAGGMLSTARLLGQSLGAALAAVTLADAAATGAGRGLLLAAGLAGCAAVVSGLRMRGHRPAA